MGASTDRSAATRIASDVNLTQAAGAGSRSAQHALASRLLGRVRATIHYLAPGHPDSDDAVQAALVEVLRAAASFRGECRLETWADRIAVRTAIRILRRSRRRERLMEPEELDAQPEPIGAPQGQQLELKEIRSRMAVHLGKLTPDRRAVVVLHWVHGYSVQEISEIVHAPPNTVRDRLQVGKKQLRQLILRDPALRDRRERSCQP